MSTVAALPTVAAAGGSFLIESRSPSEIFTPEDLSEEQRQVAATAAQFARDEILPATAAIESKEPSVMPTLLRKAAGLGLTSVDIPEEYGGMGMDKITSVLVTENIAVLGSFSTAFGGQTGIATLPVLWYGTDEQKRRCLPKLASGEWMGAYALSEASSGSDAMNVRTRAELAPDGRHYILNGEKMWITNGGFADLFTVFARIADPEGGPGKFSAFLVERNAPGFSVGVEEHKMGIRGSSTCPLVLANCKVPVENLLGEAGKGHHIAFNVLNMGRLKLGVGCVGGAKGAIAHAIRYAKERIAFGSPIADFGLIQRKISMSAARIFAAESMVHRTAGMIEAAIAALGEDSAHSPAQVPLCIEEYAVECSILKVHGSEMLSLVADELVQIMGGYGFVEEYPAERIYRDARINRIFEGTNEINRLIITGWLMKRAMKGKLPLLPAVKALMDEVMQPPSFDSGSDSGEPLAHEAATLASAKKIVLFSAGVASQRFMTGLEHQQEVMADLADAVIEIYALESSLLRARKMVAGRSGAAVHSMAASQAAQTAAAMTGLLAGHAIEAIEQCARRVLAACAEGDLLRTHLAILRRLARSTPADSVALSRAVARHCIQAERYPFQ